VKGVTNPDPVTRRTAPPPSADNESRAWLDALRSKGRERDKAIERLHALLVRAARFEVQRRRSLAPHLRGDDFEDLAMQSADDALVAILRKLDDFRGDSRFTTWVYKFALFEAAVAVRRRGWQGREVPLADAGWERFLDPSRSPHVEAESSEIVAAVRDGIAERLTSHQREVLVAVTLSGVPIDVLAERLGTTRGALYKTLHDARQKLRAHLAEIGLTPQPERTGDPR
jgi:RNA polymerase sigma-70 factor (ECF subfamily)